MSTEQNSSVLLGYSILKAIILFSHSQGEKIKVIETGLYNILIPKKSLYFETKNVLKKGSRYLKKSEEA